MPFILEGLVTTRDEHGKPHLAPMGPEVILLDPEHTCGLHFEELILKPFETSNTLRNLLRNRVGVFQITDKVEWIARGAIGQWDKEPQFFPAFHIAGDVLADACSWYEFEIVSTDLTPPRTRLTAKVVHQGMERPFVGYNRAQNAVLEAAILATRYPLLELDFLQAEFQRLEVIVDKTAGPGELEAFRLLKKSLSDYANQR
jgi:hypothetical protein